MSRTKTMATTMQIDRRTQRRSAVDLLTADSTPVAPSCRGALVRRERGRSSPPRSSGAAVGAPALRLPRWLSGRGGGRGGAVARDRMRDRIRTDVAEYIGGAREAIDDAVESELKRPATRDPPPAQASWGLACARRARRSAPRRRACRACLGSRSLIVVAVPRGRARLDAGHARLPRRRGHSLAPACCRRASPIC